MWNLLNSGKIGYEIFFTDKSQRTGIAIGMQY